MISADVVSVLLGSETMLIFVKFILGKRARSEGQSMAMFICLIERM